MAALAAAALTCALVGCAAPAEEGTPSKPVRPITPVTAGPALSSEEQALVDKAWAAYMALTDIYVKAGQRGEYDWNADPEKRPLFRYAGGRFGSALERDLDLMKEQGLIRTGAPKITLRRVVSVSPTSIVVEACVDDSGTDTIVKQTRKSVAAPGQNKRYPVTLRAGLYADGVWRWVESAGDRGSSC
ncbi:hypothetical protein F4553_003005 [Allocatelliglobosispora scoriae]|uniref:Nuclear transport factor 2 family protein n=1 Tax=Allocatelliglobosispora scoriae TaxID=643052 RepID=A0A841BQL7_9ACTN|nr:hypothetical protein [Allocatelliglobosispora scoriae]MBB5869626.1 hypothetical protein [Allocatelliglobosispora scoriae]